MTRSSESVPSASVAVRAGVRADEKALTFAQRFQKILEDLEKSRLHDRGVLYGELYQDFLFVGFALLVLETALRLTRLRRLP